VSKDLNILVVDDDSTNRVLLEAMLLKSGLNISTIQHKETLSEAIGSASAGIADVILLDLNLPDSKGLETLDKIAPMYPRKTIIVITGEYDEESGMTAISKGAHDYLMKGKFDVCGLNRSIRYGVERREAERRASYNQTILQTLVANLPQRILIKNTDSVIVYCNDKYAESLGLTPRQVIGKTDYDLYSADMAERHIAGDQEVLKSGGTTDYFIEYTENEQTRYVRVLKVAIIGEDGHSEGVLCVLEDFTDRLEIQETLKHSEARYTKLLNKSIAWYNSWKSIQN
jgi:PAS domain S-box-containing protein